MKVSFIEPDASKTRTSTPFGSNPIAYGSSHTEKWSQYIYRDLSEPFNKEGLSLPNWLIGWVQEKDLNVLLSLSWGVVAWSLNILPLEPEVFGSTAMRYSSLTTANKPFMIAIHGSIVFDEHGKSSIFFGFSKDIWNNCWNLMFVINIQFYDEQK